MQQKSRRAFIVQATLISMGIAILPQCRKKDVIPPKEKKDIVVIGVGIAGLAAAATSERYMATAHGAYISGIDAANSIIELQ